MSVEDSIETNKLIEKYISVLKGNASTEAGIFGELAWIYTKAGIIDKSEKYYRKAISLDSENPALLNNFACFLRDNKRNPEEFTKIIDKAISLAPDKYNYYNYMDTKGWGLYKYGNYQGALNILQQTWDSAKFKMYFIKSHLDEVKKEIGNQN